MTRLSHLDEEGRASMVDVSAKAASERIASAEALVVLSQEAFRLVVEGEAPKGDVIATARIAGIMAAKKTSELIPLCHPLSLSHVGIEFTPLPDRHALRIVASAKTTGPTGVEMEALTGAAVAALTVYDMIKAVDKSAVIDSVRLLSKSGGKSGRYDASAGDAGASKASSNAAQALGRVAPSPRILIHEAAGPSPRDASSAREALQSFMMARRLRPSDWAKAASVPVNQLYGYLSGRSRVLSADAAERLAKAARTTVDEMFGR